MCICTVSLTLVLDGVGGQRHAPAALPPESYTVPIVQEAGWAPGSSERVRKILASWQYEGFAN